MNKLERARALNSYFERQNSQNGEGNDRIRRNRKQNKRLNLYNKEKKEKMMIGWRDSGRRQRKE